MNLLARIKAAFTAERWLRSTMTIVQGSSDAKRQPFSYPVAVRNYASWIYAASTINAIAVASQPLRLYVRNRSAGTKLWHTRRPDRRTKAYLAGDAAQHPSRTVLQKVADYGDDYEVVTDSHPLLDLLAKVNPYQNGFDATVLRVLYGELTGNAYVHPVIDQRLGRPVELWTMPSQYVQVVPGEEVFIEGYLYGASVEQRKLFEPDEVIHFKRPNPNDLYYGMGKVEAAWGAAMQNAAIHEMDLSFFENKARPDYLLTVKGDASPEELERFQAMIESKMQGKGRVGKFLAATADIDVKPLAFPPKDLAGRSDIVEEIAAVFGVPVSMLKANDPNLASATTGYAMWRETTILPLLRMDEETLNQNLVPLFGIEDDAFLAYDNPVKGDERFEFEKRRGLVAGGIITANEARALEGMEPVDDPMADRLLVNGQPLGGPAPAPALFSADPIQRPDPTSVDGLVGGMDPKPEEQAESGEVSQVPETKSALRPEMKDALGDCVADKIPKLIDEGYPQDQAVAIAYSMCSEGKSIEAAIRSLAKAVEDVDTKPPQAVADNARRALEVRETKPESERGMTAVGIARARDLMNRESLSEDTIRRMVAYFERHEVDKQGSTWEEQGKGWQAWNGWGGDEGFAWAKRKVEEFNRERERNSERKKKSCGCECRKDSTVAAKVESKDCGTGAGGFQPGNTCGEEEGSSSDTTGTPRSSTRTLVDDVQNAEIVEDGSVRISGDDNAVREASKRLSEKWQGPEFTQDDSLKLVDKVIKSDVATQDYRDAAAAYTLTDGDDILQAQALRRSGKTFEQLELERLREQAKKPGSILADLPDEALQSRARQRASTVEKIAESVARQAQSPLPEKITVHRGMRASSDESREFLSKLQVGDAVETGIISTSLNPKVSRDYAGDEMSDRVLMKISTSRGIVAQTDERNVRYENHLQEVVLAPKRLRVRSVTRIAAETERQAAGEGWGDLIVGGETATLVLVEMDAEYD